MVNSTISLNPTALAGLEKHVLKTVKVLDELKKKLILSMPAKYGSDLWWEKAHIEADDDIRHSRVKKFKNADALVKHLKKISKSS